jgi:amino acid transporter
MCALVAVVGLAYTVICKHFPDGGGVYSAAKHRSRSLAVVGALLLCADYIITAALSAYEGFRYILPDGATPQHALYAAIGSLVMLGVLNFFGPRRAGVVALWVAVVAGVFYVVLDPMGKLCKRDPGALGR